MADVEIKYNNATIASLSDNGTEVLETNGTYLTDDISVEYTKPTPNLQSKTVSPSTSQQTVSPDSGYDGLSQVTVNAIPSGGGIQTKSVTSDYPWGNWCYVDANGVAQTFRPSGPGDGLDAVCPVGSLISVVSKNSSVPSVTNATLVWSITSSRDTYKWMGTFQVDS